MQTHTITTYSFQELSPEAQAKAIETRSQDPYNGEHEGPEAWETAHAFNRLNPPRSIGSLCLRECTSGSGSPQWETEGIDAPEGHRAWVWLLHWVNDHFSAVSLDGLGKTKVIGLNWITAVEVLQSCPLTGVFYDCEVLDPIRKALEGNPRECEDLDTIFSQCANQLAQALETNVEYHSSEECIRNYFEDYDGETEFLENGRIYS